MTDTFCFMTGTNSLVLVILTGRSQKLFPGLLHDYISTYSLFSRTKVCKSSFNIAIGRGSASSIIRLKKIPVVPVSYREKIRVGRFFLNIFFHGLGGFLLGDLQ